MQNEWTNPREYTFTNAAGEEFYEIAYSRQDVNLFAKMHKATRYRPTEDRSICKSNEWTNPREYTFTNAAGEVFYEIAYSRQDVNIFAKMHKSTNYKPTEDSSIRKSLVAD